MLEIFSTFNPPTRTVRSVMLIQAVNHDLRHLKNNRKHTNQRTALTARANLCTKFLFCSICLVFPFLSFPRCVFSNFGGNPSGYCTTRRPNNAKRRYAWNSLSHVSSRERTTCRRFSQSRDWREVDDPKSSSPSVKTSPNKSLLQTTRYLLRRLSG